MGHHVSIVGKIWCIVVDMRKLLLLFISRGPVDEVVVVENPDNSSWATRWT